MLIGELSKRTGLSRDTIRFYEKQGLIKVGRRERRVNNYKEYSDGILRHLLLFNKIKSYGFTLNELPKLFLCLMPILPHAREYQKLPVKRFLPLTKK